MSMDTKLFLAATVKTTWWIGYFLRLSYLHRNGNFYTVKKHPDCKVYVSYIGVVLRSHLVLGDRTSDVDISIMNNMLASVSCQVFGRPHHHLTCNPSFPRPRQRHSERLARSQAFGRRRVGTSLRGVTVHPNPLGWKFLCKYPTYPKLAT